MVVDQVAIDAAFAKSGFAQLPAHARAAVLRGSRQAHVLSKEYFVRADEAPRCGLLVKGFIRTVRLHPDGRELTVHWEYPGAILGLPAVVRPPAPTGIQAVVDTVFLELSVPVVREAAMADPAVAWATACILSMLLRRAVDEIVIFALGDLRSRVEWRILELACRNPPGTPLVANVTQDELAVACGAARASVARVLKSLREAGSVRPMYGGILVVKPEALAPPPHRHRVA